MNNSNVDLMLSARDTAYLVGPRGLLSFSAPNRRRRSHGGMEDHIIFPSSDMKRFSTSGGSSSSLDSSSSVGTKSSSFYVKLSSSETSSSSSATSSSFPSTSSVLKLDQEPGLSCNSCSFCCLRVKWKMSDQGWCELSFFVY